MQLERATRFLASCISDSRKSRIASAVALRTNTVAVLLENINNEGNENAVVRSMDALGFQNLHRCTAPDISLRSRRPKGRHPYMRTDSGARNWITIHNWADVTTCIRHLKDDCGYKVAVASPDASVPISKVEFTQKLAVAFGNEKNGVSEPLLRMSDLRFSLPMCGFVQSFNVSVSVAITLYHAHMQRVQKLVNCDAC